MTNPHEQPQHQKEPCFHTPVQQIGFSKYCSKCGERIDKESHPQPSKEGDVRETVEGMKGALWQFHHLIKDRGMTAEEFTNDMSHRIQSLLKEEQGKAHGKGFKAGAKFESILWCEKIEKLMYPNTQGLSKGDGLYRQGWNQALASLTHDTTQEK